MWRQVQALGDKSTLGSPKAREAHHRLNSVKNREQWKPLAPSFLAERLEEYMIDSSESPFMLRAFKVKPEMSNQIPAAVHVDGTSRAQTVTQKDSPLYHQLITELEQVSGVPAVMNTSFNLEFEPTVFKRVRASVLNEVKQSPTNLIRMILQAESRFNLQCA